MGFTERLARACAAHPRRTLVLWGVAVVVALGLVVTALHGLSSQGKVEGNPDSTKAKDAIARVFPNVVASEKQDVIVATSSRYTVANDQGLVPTVLQVPTYSNPVTNPPVLTLDTTTFEPGVTHNASWRH